MKNEEIKNHTPSLPAPVSMSRLLDAIKQLDEAYDLYGDESPEVYAAEQHVEKIKLQLENE